MEISIWLLINLENEDLGKQPDMSFFKKNYRYILVLGYIHNTYALTNNV